MDSDKVELITLSIIVIVFILFLIFGVLGLRKSPEDKYIDCLRYAKLTTEQCSIYIKENK